MAKKSDSLGGFSVSIGADTSKAKQDLSKLKSDVQREQVTITPQIDVSKIKAQIQQATVGIVAPGDLAGSMSATAMGGVVAGTTKTKVDNYIRQIQRREQTIAMNADVRDALLKSGSDVALLNKRTREKLGITTDDDKFATHLESLRRSRDPMSDAQRMRGGMATGSGDDGGDGNSMFLGGSSKLLRLSLFAYAAKEALNYASAVKRVTDTFAIEGQRLGKVSNQLASIGLSGESRTADLRIGLAGQQLALQTYRANPASHIMDIFSDQGARLEASVAESMRTAEATGASMQNMAALRVRRAASRGGVAGSPLSVISAQQTEAIRDLQTRMAEAPGASFLKQEMRMLKSTQADEFTLARSVVQGQLQGITTQADIERMRRGVTESRLLGTGRETFVAERATVLKGLELEEQQALIGKSEAESDRIRSLFRRRQEGFFAETALLNRERVENPGMALSMRGSEAGPFVSREFNMQNETNAILKQILDALTKLPTMN